MGVGKNVNFSSAPQIHNPCFHDMIAAIFQILFPYMLMEQRIDFINQKM